MANLEMEMRCTVIVKTFEKLERFLDVLTISWAVFGIGKALSYNTEYMNLVFGLFAFPCLCWAVISTGAFVRGYRENRKTLKL